MPLEPCGGRASKGDVDRTTTVRTGSTSKIMPVPTNTIDPSITTEVIRDTADIKPSLVWLMAIGAGTIVANIYYIQPLLSAIASTFRISVSQVGSVAMSTQLGVALGMLLFVPLGDTKERRSLIVKLLLVAAACLVLVATAQNFVWLAIASFGVGVAGATVHVIVPFAAHLAPAAKRGSVVGTVLSGLLFGILLARTFSGLLGQWIGWRSVYWVAAVLMLILAGLIRSKLPDSKPTLTLSWPKLVQSAGVLIKEQHVLREASLLGGIFFAAFSAFWTTLVFFLQTPPYHYGSGVTGLFGLVGAAGAFFAPFVGRLADRYGARRNVLAALVVTLGSFGVLYFFGRNLIGLSLGIILLDVGVQSGHISNQTRIYSMLPEARSRLNMVYMTTYFLAGAVGSSAGTILWQRFGWAGVCTFGSGLLVLGCIVFALGNSKAELPKRHTVQLIEP